MKSEEHLATPEQCRLLAQACEKQAATADLPLLKSAMFKLGEQWRESVAKATLVRILFGALDPQEGLNVDHVPRPEIA